MNDIVAKERGFHRGGISRLARDLPVSIRYGAGSTLFTDDGRQFLDLFANAGIASLGHGNQAFADHVSGQIGKIICSPFANEARVELWAQLSQHLPDEINRAFFFSTGAEANEAVIRFVRASTGRPAMAAFHSGFHGRTRGAAQLSVQGEQTYLFDYPVRGDKPDADLVEDCRLSVRSVFEEAGDRIGALFVEPLQGTAGNLVPPLGFLKMLRQICSEYGVLLVIDEVLTGIGRTGGWFRFLKEGAVPDLLVLGKGLGNGVPISMVLTRDAIADCPVQLSSSFGGNLLSAAAANFVLSQINTRNLNSHAEFEGARFTAELNFELQQNPLFDAIDGAGLMIGLKMRKPDQADRPLDDDGVDLVYRCLLDEGLIVGKAGPRFRINPPLVITAQEIDTAIAAFGRAFTTAAEAYPATLAGVD
ncbi:aspartate aminotransferase family protein [Agrobacterium vitis]|uniref:Aminotransferase class III-fold pyridoxal phosphate-dependent enzyme n=1 Tax=Agrobacterium vitis TaxID=373 RepID=A0AAE4WD19_AGRVI|nr:aspartate aminotransferase family protein [Agrobacterium vitis]MCF1500089.1 aspartate aminotransferase family protein [Allorhizobium sp. Av2]MCM2442226.1 aspartate aminotransferase family protein [Agrobacterium vitis]MUZ58636.1 aminotransferase class III-fold pyridoxal phosphate-dependent enzyme [Agrobacterium vitis]MVA66271.1 aminotransferase class III-fold pyridoxal phosphate-dependent enzyme [Agrobacterium vitis]MVA88308.1 aminotransferase class III-fold pyridoxal phosphate-dependent enz